MEKDEIWFDMSEDDEVELVRELLDDESPFFKVLPHHHDETETLVLEAKSKVSQQEASKQLISCSNSSSVYSGRRIEDIENALSVTTRKDLHQTKTTSINSILEGGLTRNRNRIENKYTLKVKSCGNGAMADDGYKWRKYGQKWIKNSPNPRSYYKCTNPRCSAKKQVERSRDEADTLIITYEGLHLHFAYPLINHHSTLQDEYSPSPTSTKKHKKANPVPEAESNSSQLQAPFVASQDPQEIATPNNYMQLPSSFGSRQGLLEDVVPWMIRNPSHNNNTISSNSSSCNSSNSHSPSPPTSPSSLSWPLKYGTAYVLT